MSITLGLLRTAFDVFRAGIRMIGVFGGMYRVIEEPKPTDRGSKVCILVHDD